MNTQISPNRKKKEEFVDNLAENLKEAKSVVLVNYSGLSVKSQQDLKARLKAVDGRMLVVKNTLLKLAGEAAGIEKSALSDEVLSGQTALVIADGDPVAPVQVLGKFAKESETPKFKVGVIDGLFTDSNGLSKISNLPGRDVLLSQVLGSLMSSIYGLVGTLNSPLQQLVYTLDQKSKEVSN